MKRLLQSLRAAPAIRGLLLRAALLWLGFALCQAAGLRACTGFLSGTQPGALRPELTAALGIVYLCAYVGATVLAPILLLAAGFLALGPAVERQLRRRSPP